MTDAVSMDLYLETLRQRHIDLAAKDAEIAVLRARVAKLEASIVELLSHAGWSNYPDTELREINRSVAPAILRARAALKDAPQ